MRALLALAVFAACVGSDNSTAPVPAPSGPPGPPQPPQVGGRTRRHMHWRLADVRQIERYLLADQLDEAKARAYILTLPLSDPGLAPWSRESARVTELAGKVANPITGVDALRDLGTLDQACGECHLHAQARLRMPPLPEAPADDGTRVRRMARHQWAADRLAEGIVLANDARWHAGLVVLAADPLPYPKLTDAPAAATALAARAKAALQRRPDETFDDRAAAYGAMLVECAACHHTLAVAQRAR